MGIVQLTPDPDCGRDRLAAGPWGSRLARLAQCSIPFRFTIESWCTKVPGWQSQAVSPAAPPLRQAQRRPPGCDPMPLRARALARSRYRSAWLEGLDTTQAVTVARNLGKAASSNGPWFPEASCHGKFPRSDGTRLRPNYTSGRNGFASDAENFNTSICLLRDPMTRTAIVAM